MKTWNCIFWRSNPQLSKGGYETVRKVEARTATSAVKKAALIYGRPVYGGMTLLRVEAAE